MKRSLYVSGVLVGCLMAGGPFVVSQSRVRASICPFPPKLHEDAKCQRAGYSTDIIDNMSCQFDVTGTRCETNDFGPDACEGTFWTVIVNGKCQDLPEDSGAGAMNCEEHFGTRRLQIHSFGAHCKLTALSECRCTAHFHDPPVSEYAWACECRSLSAP